MIKPNPRRSKWSRSTMTPMRMKNSLLSINRRVGWRRRQKGRMRINGNCVQTNRYIAALWWTLDTRHPYNNEARRRPWTTCLSIFSGPFFHSWEASIMWRFWSFMKTNAESQKDALRALKRLEWCLRQISHQPKRLTLVNLQTLMSNKLKLIVKKCFGRTLKTLQRYFRDSQPTKGSTADNAGEDFTTVNRDFIRKSFREWIKENFKIVFLRLSIYAPFVSCINFIN